MELKLNAKGEAYKEFYGKNIEQMPKLVAEGRVPMSVAGLMQRRLDVRNSDDKVKAAWMSHYFCTGDAVIYNPDGKVKIVLDSENLRNVTPDTPRNSGALIVTPEAYDALQGEEFRKGKLGKIGDWITKKDVKAHPIWRALARDQALLNDYADYIFAEAKDSYGYDVAMGVFTYDTLFTGSAGEDTPEMRAWIVDGLGGGSCAGGGVALEGGGCGNRLLGIAPEAQETNQTREAYEESLNPTDKNHEDNPVFYKPAESLEGKL